jgi:NAD(P)-dependent dehydrogenase (short-subunit alcohol dehydrogenase family)
MVTFDQRSRTVVITGASSGLGRAAAVRFASRGDNLVLGARREAALRETAEICERAGARTVALVGDVTREEDVRRLADTAVQTFGGIDVWVNNAGVTLFGSLEQAPLEEHRRVIEVNLFGAIHGARAALPVFRKQQRGVLINVGSILSKIGQPFVPSYVISKFALRGLSEALRAEVAPARDIHVCTLLPYAFNTPHFESGANHLGRDPHAMAPAQDPGVVARALVDLADHPRRERHVPRSALLGLGMHALFPRTVERLVFHALSEWHFGYELEAPTAGNLFAPSGERPRVRGSRPPRAPVSVIVGFLLRNLLGVLRPSPVATHPPEPHELAQAGAR